MSDLNLTGQSTLAGQVQTRITQLRNAMDLRKEVWNRLPIAKKKAWITSGKDPLMTLSWKIYRYLRDNFFGQEVDNG
jgi:hypothetical protein